jgi:uncharacterized protein YjdB
MVQQTNDGGYIITGGTNDWVFNINQIYRGGMNVLKTVKNSTAIIMALIILLLLNTWGYAAVDNDDFLEYAKKLEQINVIRGTDLGFELDRAPTRLEGIIMLIRLLGKEKDADNLLQLPTVFEDVPEWAWGYVNYAYINGLSKGIGNNMFGADGEMTGTQYMTLVIRALGYQDSKGDFTWTKSLDMAKEIGLIDSGTVRELGSGKFTRGHVAKISYLAFAQNLKNSNTTLAKKLINENVFTEERAEAIGIIPKRTGTTERNSGRREEKNMKIADEYSDGVPRGGNNVVEEDLWVAPKSVTLNYSSLNLKINETVQLTATVLPGDASDKEVTWASDNQKVATVTASGRVTAKGAGNAVITVRTRDGNRSASCSAKVEKPNEYLADGIYNFYLKDGGKALNLSASTDEKADKDGTNVTVWEPTGHSTQQFRVENIGGNKCKIYAMSSSNGTNRVINMTRGTSKTLKVGNNINIWESKNSTDREWIITKMPDGYYKIEVACIPGIVMGCEAPNKNGGNVLMQQYTGSGAQLWRAEPVTKSAGETKPVPQEKMFLYWQHDPQWNLPRGGCGIASYAILISNKCGNSITPKMVYEANGKSVYMPPWSDKNQTNPILKGLGISYKHIRESLSGKNNSYKIEQLKKLLKDNPKGVMAGFAGNTSQDGQMHYIVFCSADNKIYVCDPATSKVKEGPCPFEKSWVYTSKDKYNSNADKFWEDIGAYHVLK